MKHYHYLKCRVLVLGLTLSAGAFLQGQTAADDDEVIELSPFEVTSQTDSGYSATHTLAGTRIRTDLRDVASVVTVVTSQFLEDTNSNDVRDLLVYTPSTEVGGVYGNFSGTGGASTYNEAGNLLRPSNNTRVRGLDAADNTRDFMLTEIPWDGYAVDRVEILRGPNSILFGVGSPSGIINTVTKTAVFQDITEVELGVGSFGSARGSFDVNKEVIAGELSVRLLGLYDETKFNQDPAFERDNRFLGAIRWEPKPFGEGAATSLRANYESGDVTANRPRSLPPIDAITPWFLTGSENGIPNMNKITLNPNTTWNQYGNNPNLPNFTYPWFREAFLGRMFSSDIGGFYNANDPTPMFTMMPSRTTSWGLDSAGNIDGTIGGFEFSRLWGIATYNNYARTAIPGGKYYSNVSIDDTSIFDFYEKLMDGDNKREWQDWDTYNISLSQTFLHNRIGVELVYFEQSYEDGQYSFLGGDQYALSVDINTHLIDGSPNPNVGRPYVASSGQYGNNMNLIDRDSLRVTGFAEFRFSDVMDESWLTRALGRHVLTGLYSDDTKETDYRSFARWASSPDYTTLTTSPGGSDDNITNGSRQYDWVAYLGPSLISASSASGANLGNVSATIRPMSPVGVHYYDSRWNPASFGVPYDAPYTYYTHDSDGNLVTNEGTQVDNPANYMGWSYNTFGMLSAEGGDIDQLYTQIQKSKNTIESTGITLQSFFLDGAVVATYGWREDKVRNLAAQGAKLAYDVSDPNNSIQTGDESADGQSRSWGVVVHTPDSIAKKLPFGTNISLFYNEGENFKADSPRGDIWGNQIPNPKGETTDYGFVLSTMENRLIAKVTWYETKVANASLQADSAGFSGNLYYVWALPYWGATHALAALDGIADPQIRQGNWGWPWNGIAVDANGDPDRARIRTIVEDFFSSFPLPQSFADEYGLGMNVDAMRAATSDAQRYASVPTYGVGGQGASALGLQPAYGGTLRSFGSGPVASVDTTSEGVEVELTARVTDNWDLTFNVSKTEATRSAISPTIDTFIQTYTDFLAGDAGLVKLWGGDPIRTVWANAILAPYAVLTGQIGSAAPEVSPWRFNLVTNYRFSDGALEGFNAGIAYRWEDERILGYQYDEDNDVLDIDRPWYGPTEDHIDFWVGYEIDLKWDVRWRIQLNVRNAFEDPNLTPVTIQPDGTVALSRIQEGMTWMVTNTFSF